MILLTLEKSFGQCRAFHDTFGELPEEKYETELVNIVSNGFFNEMHIHSHF